MMISMVALYICCQLGGRPGEYRWCFTHHVPVCKGTTDDIHGVWGNFIFYDLCVGLRNISVIKPSLSSLAIIISLNFSSWMMEINAQAFVTGDTVSGNRKFDEWPLGINEGGAIADHRGFQRARKFGNCFSPRI
jgi:hypothetical protein